MEKLADSLQRLGEDDLLRVVEMVHDHKSPDTYTKNDVEREYIRLSIKRDPKRLMKCHRGRISRGPLHPTRRSSHDVVGLLPAEALIRLSQYRHFRI